MIIIRAPRPESHYLLVANDLARDTRLSYRARGLLVAILSRPDNWSTTSEQLADEAKEGRDAVRTALKELEQVGYLTRNKIQGERGRWQTVTVVSEQAELEPSTPDPPTPGNPSSVAGFQSPTPGNPTPGNPTLGKPGAKREQPRRTTKEVGAPAENPFPPEDHHRTAARRRDRPLPEDWSPHEGHRKTAERRGLDLEDEIARFRLFAVERGRLAQDWNAAFERWLLDSRPRPKVTVDAGTYVPGWG